MAQARLGDVETHGRHIFNACQVALHTVDFDRVIESQLASRN